MTKENEIEEIAFFRMAMQLSGITIDPRAAELVYRIYGEVKEKKNSYSIEDASRLEVIVCNRWEKFTKSNENDR